MEFIIKQYEKLNRFWNKNNPVKTSKNNVYCAFILRYDRKLIAKIRVNNITFTTVNAVLICI